MTRFVVLFAALFCLATAFAPAGEKIYVGSNGYSYLQEIDIETGDRRYIYLDNWPYIIQVSDYAVDSDGTILIETADGLQRRGIYRYSPATGATTPVSGGVDGLSTGLRGSGPPIDAGLNTLLLGEGDDLFVLRTSKGPMHIDLPTGNRRIVSQSDSPTTGTIPSEIPMYSPQDMTMLGPNHLVVGDRFDGFIRVNIATGERSRMFSPTSNLYNPMRFDRTDDGILVFTIRDPDTPTLFGVDPRNGVQFVYSGSFGGISRGEGPEFKLPADMMVDGKGRLWVYDTLIPAIFRVDQKGNRTIVSSAEVGHGDWLADYTARPLMGTYRLAVPPAEVTTGWVIF